MTTMIYRGFTHSPMTVAAPVNRPRLTYRGVDHRGYDEAPDDASVTVSLHYRGVAYQKSVATPRVVEGLAPEPRRMMRVPLRSPAAAG